MSSYVKFETPKDLVPQILEMLSVAKDNGKLKKGVNETTKAIERKTAQFVILAEDVQPEEIVVHIPMLCEEKGIPFAYVPTRIDLGKAVGILVGASSIAVENAGGASETLQDIMKKLPKHSAAAPTEKAHHEKPHAEKPAEAKEEKATKAPAKPKAPKKAKEEKAA